MFALLLSDEAARGKHHRREAFFVAIRKDHQWSFVVERGVQPRKPRADHVIPETTLENINDLQSSPQSQHLVFSGTVAGKPLPDGACVLNSSDHCDERSPKDVNE
jgi:hypothetical protein